MPPTARFIDTNGVRLACDVRGEGPAVVLLHAGNVDRRMWDDQLPALAERHRVIRYDLRGYGESSAPPGEFAPHEDLAGLLHSLGVERAALVGASLGGKVAIDAALAYPDLVSGLVLVGAVPEGFSTDALIDAFEAAITPALTAGDLDRAAQISLLYFLVGPRREPEQVAPDVRQRAQVMARRTLERLTSGEPGGHHRPLDPPAINRLVDLRLPTLVIAGDLDHPEYLAGSELLAAGIPGARKVGIPGTAHLPSLERPDEFNRVVLEFLAELPA